jgi:hypothetical protein
MLSRNGENFSGVKRGNPEPFAGGCHIKIKCIASLLPKRRPLVFLKLFSTHVKHKLNFYRRPKRRKFID